MAKLLSEDKELRTSLEIDFLKEKIKNKLTLTWIPYKILLKSGKNQMTYEKNRDNGTGDYLLSVKPLNEMMVITEGIKKFLDSDSPIFSFEPVEPSFELILEKSHNGFAVTCWLDAGNVISDHYTWDGFGLRFFTNKKNIMSFVKELDKETTGLFVRKDLCRREKTLKKS